MDTRVTGSAPEKSTLERHLEQVAAAIRLGDPSSALRFADAARRIAESPETLQLLARVCLMNDEVARAIDLLEQALELSRTSELEADLAAARMRGDREAEAFRNLHAALLDFAVEPTDPLAEAARRLIGAFPGRHGGWVAVSSDLTVRGELPPGAADSQLEVPPGFTATFEDPQAPGAAGAGWRRFSLTCRTRSEEPILLRAGGLPLLGSGLSQLPPFQVDGRIILEDGEVHGWATIGWSPRIEPRLVVSDDQGRRRSAEVAPDPDRPGRYLYRVQRSNDRSPAREIFVEVTTPDGSPVSLPDSPLLIEVAPPLPALSPAPKRAATGERSADAKIDIVIPVYRGWRETIDCISSVEATTHRDDVEIVVIDDCSPDPRLSEALDMLAARGAITLLRNVDNLGFPATVNRGLELHPGRDAVILNADAEVFAGWLERLKRAAYQNGRVGTVTPLTNSGSIASYPAENAAGASDDAAAIAAICAAENDGFCVESPTAVGFCMFVRRDCLDEIGLLDAATFRKGYGEENDLCLRASALGWKHLIAADVYVRHVGSRSFGQRRDALLERNLGILTRRYPHYQQMIDDYKSADPLRLARRRIDEARLKASDAPIVLLLSLNGEGGVARFVRERVDYWRGLGVRTVVMTPAKPDAGLPEVGKLGAGILLEASDGAPLSDLVYRPGEELEAVRLLGQLRVFNIEFHHFMDIDGQLVDEVLKLGVPVDVYIHDYSWICTRITLLNEAQRYCGEPSINICEACGEKADARIQGVSIRELRRRSDRWFGQARSLIVPSNDVEVRLGRYFPSLKFEVRPWQATAPARSPTPPRSGASLKVAVIGAIGEHKGYSVLRACAEDAVARDLPIEFTLIGFSEDDEPLLKIGNIFISGEYEEAEITDLLAREAPHIALFASIWPETWCFALTHALDAGLPVFAFDIGTIAERLRSSPGRHELLRMGMEAGEINDRLLATQLHHATIENETLRDGISSAPAVVAGEVSVLQSENVISKEAHAAPSGAPMPEFKSALSVTGELVPLAKGIYQFYVKSAAPKRVGEDEELVLPAMHVGPGPGVPVGNIEIMPGLRNDGCWLYEARDTLIVKVKSSPTSVLLTSLRTEGMAALEVAMERIDARRAPPTPAPAMVALPGPAPVQSSAAATTPAQALAMEVAASASPRQSGEQALRIQIVAHIRSRGDTSFVDTFWAGAVGEKLPIEAFAVLPADEAFPARFEYKSLTASGVESPWVTDGDICGTRGANLPLIGFAVRPKGDDRELFDCEYRGAFRSGKIVGPVTNGPSKKGRSPHSIDFLEGNSQLTIVRRADARSPAQPVVAATAKPAGSPSKARKPGPKFSVFREE